MELSTMTQDERSLLLYLETCAVDHAGLVDTRHMNLDDMTIAKQWNDSEFIKFGRVQFSDIYKNMTHWCTLSDEAWTLAHAERRARNARTYTKRTWLTTDEKRALLAEEI